MQAFAEAVNVTQLAFPNHEDIPSHFSQSMPDGLVSRPISCEFFTPELDARFRHRPALATRVPVPEAPMNEYDLSATGKDEIGTARKSSIAQPESKPHRMREAANGKFR